MKTIYLLTTGGTIEKVYSEGTGSVTNAESKIDRYFKRLRLPDAEINIVPLMNKDSLEMTDADRLLLLGMVRAILKENAPMVITHGTDTMVQSGLYLERALPGLQLPIVMTGAMTPLGFEDSDGLQNLTESLLAVRLLTNLCSDAWPDLPSRPRSQGSGAWAVCLGGGPFVLACRLSRPFQIQSTRTVRVFPSSLTLSLR
jgi:L-asparaginase